VGVRATARYQVFACGEIAVPIPTRYLAGALRRNQEQAQMITAAIGRPKAKATAITDVIAESKSSSGCTLSSSDMAYTTLCLEAPG
jgi:hypothetical protein